MPPNNKLTDQDRTEIERILVHGEPVRRQSGVVDVHYPTYKVLGARYGVTDSAIGRFAKNRRCQFRRKAAKALREQAAMPSSSPAHLPRDGAQDTHTIDYPVPSIDMPPRVPETARIEDLARPTLADLPDTVTDAHIINATRRVLLLSLLQAEHALHNGDIKPSNASISKACTAAVKLTAQKSEGGDDADRKRILRILQDVNQGSPSSAPSGAVH